MKKILFFLLTLVLSVFVLASCDTPTEKEPTQEQPAPTQPTEEPTTGEETKVPTPVVEEHYNVLGGSSAWEPSSESVMFEITEENLAQISEQASAILANRDVKAVYALPNYEIKTKGEWTFTAKGVEYDGGHSLKVVQSKYESKWDEDEEAMVESWAVTEWIPDPHKAHAESLTPSTYFVPAWRETAPEGDNLGTWADNPCVTAPDGEYHIIVALYDAVSDAETPAYGIAVIPAGESVNYNTVGGLANDWGPTETNIMTEIDAAELANIDADLAATVAGKDKVAGIYAMYNYHLNVGAGWTTPVFKDGKPVQVDGGFTIKTINSKVVINYDEDEEGFVKVASVTQWIPDPKTAHAENLSPETLFIPIWRESDADGDGLGTWDQNPACISGAGYYTVVLVVYDTVSDSTTPAYGIALVLTEKLEDPKTTAQLITEEHAALVAGTVTEATKFENVAATVVALDTAENTDGGLDVTVTAELDGIQVTLLFAAADVVGLEVGKEVKFSGYINPEASAVEIVFSNAEVEWAKVGAPSELYVKGTLNEWSAVAEYVLTYNEAGNPEITLELTADTEFKVADSAWSNDKTFGYHDGLSAAFADNGGNIKVVTTGTYTLTVVDGKLEITAGRSGIYLKGTLNGWSDKAEYELRVNADSNPTITVTLAANDEFKVATPDWSTVDLGSSAVQTELTDAFDLSQGNIKVVTAGTYVVTIVEGKLVITAAE